MPRFDAESSEPRSETSDNECIIVVILDMTE
jgi:hypothetical protein